MKQLLRKAVSTILATMIIAGASISSYASQNVEKVDAFVERCYSVILGRSSDVVGRQYWVNKLLSGEGTGISVAYGFVFSSEYKSMNKTNEEYLMDLYNTFLEGRNPDPVGWEYWLTKLNNGEDDKNVVFNGFACSQEFRAYCTSYGISAGDPMQGYESARENRAAIRSFSALTNDISSSIYLTNPTEVRTYTIDTANGPVTVTGYFAVDRENEILSLLNDYRIANGVAPLEMTDDLRECARIRAIETTYMFSHTRPDNSRCFTAFPDDYAFKAENIAAGRRTAVNVMNDWAGSGGHNRNMLCPDYTSIGIGCFVCTDGENAGNLNDYSFENYYTQEFGG